MTIDSYEMPTLRRAVLRMLRLELWVGDALRALRQVSGWWLLCLAFALFALLARTWFSVAVFGGLLVLALGIWIAERREFTLARVDETDSLSGREFERWLAHFLEDLGFSVEHVGRAGDFGADLIATWNGVRTVVQAKAGHYNVGVSAVQQVHAARRYYGCERAMVVTNQYFTAPALVLAEKTGVVMRHRGDLARILAAKQAR